ncbi:MAG: hypothetical protein HOV79_17630 [Hamadaea sp.]|nr:hypothetical protein [Hamadaea sp.]
MRYLLLYFVDEAIDTPQGAPDPALDVWLERWRDSGVLLHGDRLRPTADAATVRRRGAETLVSDGPFAETKEQVAGYDLIECDDLEAALEIASGHPAAALGTVEVRPIWT